MGLPDQRVPNLVPYFIPLLFAFARPRIQVQLWFTGSVIQLHCQCVFPLHFVGQSTFAQEKKMLKLKAQPHLLELQARVWTNNILSPSFLRGLQSSSQQRGGGEAKKTSKNLSQMASDGLKISSPFYQSSILSSLIRIAIWDNLSMGQPSEL